MRRDRQWSVEGLEARKLLSTAHGGVKQPAVAEVAPTPTLNGTLAVDYQATSEATDMYGNYVSSTPVDGTLGSVGKVRGAWTRVTSTAGMGSDVNTLQLKDAQGALTLTFSTDGKGKVHKTASGGSYDPVAQHVSGSSGALAHAVEKGKLLFNTDRSGKDIESITLTTKPS